MRKIIAGLVLLASTVSAPADEPTAPPPRVLPPELLPPLGFYRHDPYEVWQNLAVDYHGFFRARVIDTPYGAFYRYNGKPYPWTTTTQKNYMPYAIGTPYPWATSTQIRLMPEASD
jgi:hypothetical protein